MTHKHWARTGDAQTQSCSDNRWHTSRLGQKTEKNTGKRNIRVRHTNTRWEEGTQKPTGVRKGDPNTSRRGNKTQKSK